MCSASQCVVGGTTTSCMLDPTHPCGKWYANVTAGDARSMTPAQLQNWGRLTTVIESYCALHPTSPECTCFNGAARCGAYRSAASCTFLAGGRPAALMMQDGEQAGFADVICATCRGQGVLMPVDMA
jgi:hypothetical protein